jgi:hypothetical protein
MVRFKICICFIGDWIYVTQYRDQWCTFVNMLMNLHVPQNVGKFLTKQLIAFQEDLLFMEFLN